jgi:RES domain-containing protein
MFDGMGATLVSGRWHTARGRPLIYACASYSSALLERLVAFRGWGPPPTLRWVEITVPAGVSTESLDATTLPGWSALDYAVSQPFGDRWLDERRSAVLIVPSAVAQPVERNILINPQHLEFRRITHTGPTPVLWDVWGRTVTDQIAGARRVGREGWCRMSDLNRRPTAYKAVHFGAARPPF